MTGWRRGAIALFLLSGLLAGLACGQPTSPAPAGSSSQPAAGGPVSDAAYRQQVIDAARAEGEVTATIHTSWSPEGLQRLEETIQREYGVRVRINFTPVGNYTRRTGEFLSEVEANARPSFDLYQTSDSSSALMRRADAVEPVQWIPLLPDGTPPSAVANEGAHLVVYTDHFGLMSDPTVIPDADVPRSLKDLANPRWRGKVMLAPSATIYMPWVILQGREETLATLRAAVQNAGLVDTYPNQFTRFAAKEYPLSATGVTFHHIALARGIPSRFTPLDFSANTDHHVSVARRAVHPNAAKLLAAVLAGPEGQRIQAEYIGVGSRYYQNTRENELEDEALAAGFPSFAWTDYPDAMAFVLSPEGEELQKEMERILRGG